MFLKKTENFKTANSQNLLATISGIGPWVSRISLCEGIGEVVGHKLKNSIKTQKMQYIFCQFFEVKFKYSEKATKCCKISTVYLTVTTQDKFKLLILQNLCL